MANYLMKARLSIWVFAFRDFAMTAKTMLVRTLGGDVIRRDVAVPGVAYIAGKAPEARPVPVLRDGETYTWPNGDDMPTIINTQ